jgi:hypothetical protein
MRGTPTQLRGWLLLTAWVTFGLLFGSVAVDAWSSGVLVIPKGRGLSERVIARATQPGFFLLGVGVLGSLAVILLVASILTLAALIGKAPRRVTQAVKASFGYWDWQTPTRWHPLWLLAIVAVVAGIVYVAA